MDRIIHVKTAFLARIEQACTLSLVLKKTIVFSVLFVMTLGM